jgi:hypothetical protein
MRAVLPVGVCFSVAMCFSMVACSSYETTYFGKDEHGNVTTKTIAGVPIVVTVPQKLGFMATKSCYRIETLKTVNEKPVVVATDSTEVSIDKTPISLGASQLVNLDIKRPAYGTAKNKLTLASSQYPTEVSSDVDDKTLGRALDTLDKFIEKQAEPPAGGINKTLIGQQTYMIIYDPVTMKVTQDQLSRSSKGCG